MSERLVLGVTGSPGTGKSTVAQYLNDEHDFTIFESSSIIKARAKFDGLKLVDRAGYDSFFRNQQNIHGKSWLADLMIKSDVGNVVQSGLRAKYDFLRIKEAGGVVIALSCPPQICIDRIDTSNPKNPQTVDEYVEHQLIEESINDFGTHTNWCVNNADYNIDTSQPIADTLHLVSEVVAELLAK